MSSFFQSEYAYLLYAVPGAVLLLFFGSRRLDWRTYALLTLAFLGGLVPQFASSDFWLRSANEQIVSRQLPDFSRFPWLGMLLLVVIIVSAYALYEFDQEIRRRGRDTERLRWSMLLAGASLWGGVTTLLLYHLGELRFTLAKTDLPGGIVVGRELVIELTSARCALIGLIVTSVNFFGRITDVSGKHARIMLRNGVRTGDESREGFSPEPGFLPLQVEFVIELLLKFRFGYRHADEEVSVGDHTSVHSIVAQLSDGPLVLVAATVQSEVVNAHAFDQARGALAEGLSEMRSHIDAMLGQAVAPIIARRFGRLTSVQAVSSLSSALAVQGDELGGIECAGLRPRYIAVRFERLPGGAQDMLETVLAQGLDAKALASKLGHLPAVLQASERLGLTPAQVAFLFWTTKQ